MDFIAIGNTMTDSIMNQDGSCTEYHMGGPSPFAYAGIRIWNDSCSMITNVGEDYNALYGDWIRKNQVCTDGITVVHETTHNNILTYNEDGTYGASNLAPHDYATEMGYMEVKPEQIEQFTKGAKAVYFFFDAYNPVFWEEFARIKEKNGFEFMWEASGVTSTPEYLDRIKKIISDCKVEQFSINYPETKSLFGVDTREDALAALKTLGVPFIIMRDGKNGMYTIKGDKHYLIPSVDMGKFVDQTGCGNCSTGAAMYAYYVTRDPVMAGIMANISSGYNICQFGLTQQFTPEMRTRAEETAQQMYADYLQQHGLNKQDL
ncbi:ribokinase [Anaerotruncus sp. 2789STDY5834896]|uniref:Ribokinase n=1 Tax=uncultured Anaerotruncus sp. TaxID=905011 RepID=A0A1C6KCF1_9FIRM|nr:ribokinase [uncultured Anaerotruncus sp.]